MLTITPIYAGLLAMLIIVLAIRVVKFRRGEHIALGDETGSWEMKRAVRAHANAAENIPIGLILLGLLELNQLASWITHLMGFTLLTGRVLHGIGLSQKSGPSFGRFYGTIITWLAILIMAVLNLVVVLTR